MGQHGWLGLYLASRTSQINSPMGFSGYAFDDSMKMKMMDMLLFAQIQFTNQILRKKGQDTEDNYVDSDEESEEEEQQEETVVKRRVKN